MCAGLAGWLREMGLLVDHFAEEEILTRSQFAEVAEHFRATGKVKPAMLLKATSAFVQSELAAGFDVVVADALVPFVPSLLAMGLDEQAVDGFVAELTKALAPVEAILVFLDGDAGTALARAAAREGSGWLDWYIGKLVTYGLLPDGGDLASAVAYLEHERAVTLSAARHSGWSVLIIDGATEFSPAEILRNAKQLGELIGAGRA